MILYDYFRSTASYRVRIALKLKEIHYESVSIALTEHEQHEDSYKHLNPQQLVPMLDDEGRLMTQSLAILEYLEERYPSPLLLPKDPYARAQVRGQACFIASEMHPMNNLRVREQLQDQFKATPESLSHWIHHWLRTGFDALEIQLQQTSKGQYCFGDSVTMADLCLIPQVYGAMRFEFDLQSYPLIQNINQHCLTHQAFLPPA